MLDTLRRASSTWVAKGLMALLVLSFGVWGIADVFRTGTANEVAHVGSTSVKVAEFDNGWRRMLNEVSRRRGTPLSREEAARAGLPEQYLLESITNAAILEQARILGLGISDEELRRQILADKTFVGINGQFDPKVYTQVLRDNGWTDVSYEQFVRSLQVRRQLADAIAAPLPPPKALVELINRYGSEERTVDYMSLQPQPADAVADPAADVLTKFFEERKQAFRTQEMRKVTMLSVSPAALAKPEDVSDDDARAVYQSRLSTYNTPERRRIEQLPFDDQAAAEAAAAELKAGKTFDDLLAARNLKAADVDLGLMERSGYFDKTVGDAVFALEQGAVSDVIAARVKPVIVRLAEVKPASTKPFDEVAPAIKAQLALQHAGDRVNELRDQIEDARAGGAKLAEVASRFGLLPAIDVTIDRSGNGPDGQALPGVPEPTRLAKAAFDADVNIDTDPLALPGQSYLWYDVTAIEPARDRALDEVKADVIARWKDEQARQALTAKADDAVARIQKGETFADVAASLGAEVQTSAAIKRAAPVTGLSQQAAMAAFGGPEGFVTSAAGTAGGRIVLVVKDVKEPVFFAEDPTAKQLSDQIAQSYGASTQEQLGRQLRSAFGTTINHAAVNQITGTSLSN